MNNAQNINGIVSLIESGRFDNLYNINADLYTRRGEFAVYTNNRKHTFNNLHAAATFFAGIVGTDYSTSRN